MKRWDNIKQIEILLQNTNGNFLGGRVDMVLNIYFIIFVPRGTMERGGVGISLFNIIYIIRMYKFSLV